MTGQAPATTGLDRRGFLKLVGTGAGAGALALALPVRSEAALPGHAAAAGAPGRLDAGYRETAHVRAYYDTCR